MAGTGGEICGFHSVLSDVADTEGLFETGGA